ncbi:permease prefix domain 1-containing protein [Paenibacillus doosanensis]|uniref:permease prefix domain 1-containing protein n=1 Tax=Paenibacillus doosanensis TaxID=1229154 RepID=UPI00217F677E|nr:permease prefix domain 1-containing protein [Paenibacillus doosanensis]MCS7460750.1 permease prefix domain 1-containing protein [Paenibacillus doosanensis]
MSNPIDRYIDSLYRDYDAGSAELTELKAEMKQHLLDAVRDLKAQGYTDEESAKIALDRFGDEDSLSAELQASFKLHRTFARGLLYASLVFAFIGIVVAGWFLQRDYHASREHSALTLGIGTMLKEQTAITPQLKEELDSFASQHMYGTRYIAVFQNPSNDPIFPQPLDRAVYIYPPDATHDTESGMGGGTDGYWSTQAQQERFVTRGYGAGWSLPFFAAYWLLFAIWGFVNAYRERRLTIIWGAAFACLNVFAYLLFRIRRKWLYH